MLHHTARRVHGFGRENYLQRQLHKHDEGFTRRHSLRVGLLMSLVSPHGMLIGKWHDIGKLAVDRQLLLRKGRLSDSEYEEIKKHPVEAINVIRKSGVILPQIVLKAAISHHLKFGYAIPLAYPTRWFEIYEDRYHCYGYEICKSDDLVCASLRLADAIEAATSDERKDHQLSMCIDSFASEMRPKIKVGVYSPFPEVNEQLPDIFTKMVELRRNNYQKAREVGSL